MYWFLFIITYPIRFLGVLILLLMAIFGLTLARVLDWVDGYK